MSYFIGSLLIFIIWFTLMLFYKLADVNWYHQFINQDFSDKDYFTRLVKWLMS